MQGTRKEREREFKRREILSAATEIIAAKGFNNATLEEIAEASEFGKGTLYNYFQNKQEIYVAIMEDIFETFITSLKKIDEECDNAKDFFRAVIRYMVSYCVNNPSAFQIMAQKRMSAIEEKPESISPKIKMLLDEGQKIQVKKIEKAIKAKEIRNIDPNKLMDLIRGMTFSYVYHQLACHKGVEFNVDDESEYVVSVLLNGIVVK